MALKQLEKEARDRYLERLQLIRLGAVVNPFETPEEKAAVIERSKKEVAFFVKTFLPHMADCDSADFQIRLANRVAKNVTCRELVRWGRGLAKSVWCDLIIPLWLWVRGEDIYIVIVGNNKDKAILLLSDLQAEFEANQTLIHYFGEQQLRGSWEKGNFQTKDNRFRGKAIGMGESPRGLRIGAVRPNYVVPDDLEDAETVKNPKRQDEIITWIEGALLKTMDGPVRRYLHPNNDFAPRTIQNQLEKRHPKWHVDLVKAYDKVTYKPAWSQKYSDTYYKEIEEDGILSAYAEYLHEPVVEGKVFTHDLIQWGKLPRLNTFKMIAAHWDVAYSGKNDYNAVSVFGLHGINFWKIKAFCRQCKMEDAVRFMYDYEATLPAGIIIQWRVEAQFWNDPVKAAIKQVCAERGRWLNIAIVERSRSNKYSRILTMHPYYQSARVYYNQAEEANNDMQVGLSQLYAIEPGYTTHDDDPDADQQVIEYLSEFVNYGINQGYGIESGGSFRSNRM
ncbi:MAG: hypothetical protein RSA53_05465 [Odoribacter sp.]